MRTCNLLVILALCCGYLSAQSMQKRANCVDCHRSQGLSQPDTQMGRALQLPPLNATLNAHPRLIFHRGRFSYTVETQNGQSRYIVSDGAQTISLPILWSMGSQAQTWVLEHGGQMYESLVSYYPSIQGLDVTVGDDSLSPQTVQEAIGRPLDDAGVRTCFGCHASNAVIDHKLNLTAFKPGVNCGHCHIGADAHLAAMLRGDANVYPPDLGGLSTEDISSFCGQCHRTWDLVVRAGWRGSSNVRFQPYRLALSKCYDGTDSRISCIACHDPHHKVTRDPASYDSKCLACHSSLASAQPPHAKVCPVAKSKCASCHMPKVKYPGGHFVFTDHYIRLVKTNEPYPY
jgi:hypothetical protein